jgi:hypothetical protein
MDTQTKRQGPPDAASLYGGMLLGNKRWIDQNPKLAKGVVSAIVAADKYIKAAYFGPKTKANAAARQKIAKIVAQFTGFNTSPDQAALIASAIPDVAKLAQPQVNCTRLANHERVDVKLGTLTQLPACSSILSKYTPRGK